MKKWNEIVHESLINITKRKGNWSIGKIDNYRFEAMVFDEPSENGINNGKISKLFLYNKNNEMVGAFERGMDIEPSGNDKKIWNKIIQFFE